MSHPTPTEFDAQDWIIIVEALAQWAGDPRDCGGREERAYELVEAIATYQGLPASELVLQEK